MIDFNSLVFNPYFINASIVTNPLFFGKQFGTVYGIGIVILLQFVTSTPC